MDNNHPKVSVILPTYNRGNIISNCINSVISQEYSNWELIISDDGSSDKTEEVCTSFKDDRIKYYRNENNLGLPGNRNAAIDKTSGDFILFTEDDMVLKEDCIKLLVETYQNISKDGINVGSVCPALISSFEDEGKKRNMLNFARRSKEEELSHNPSVIDKKTGLIYRNFSADFKEVIEVNDCHSCSLYPKNIYDEFRYEENAYKGSYTGEESDFHFKLTKKGYKLYFQPEAIMFHNVESEGGCRLPLYSWSYYFIRNHIIFLIRNFGIKSVYMAPYFLLFVLYAILHYYLGEN
ncbi:MAG: glycosyltransferase family 2 protein [Methanobacterium sp.]|uniref:glycosyltransferase family 2 protein n=1 Tax=Methanobacterium sp. TaxID=2164 RepID=UPI003D65B5F5|nr:glycosyltransferase family 2 protein [Methanobacterium sp.]